MTLDALSSDPRYPDALARRPLKVLRFLRERRAHGERGSFTTDPAWLVEQAINKRAGWAECAHVRGSCLPVRGKLPRACSGMAQAHLGQLARRINTPRLIVRASELGEWRGYLLARIPDRFEP